jgi:hypothetical protein
MMRMKSILIAGVLVALFAWIHADKPGQAVSHDTFVNEYYQDTTPLQDLKPMNKKKDTTEHSLQFRDTSAMKKSKDSSYRKK